MKNTHTAPSPEVRTAATPNRRWFASAAIGGLGALAAVAASAQGMPGMGGPMGGSGGMGHPMEGMMGGMRGRHGMDPEAMARRMEGRIYSMVKEVGGTGEQADKVVAIVRNTFNELKPLREQHMAARRKGLELLSAPTLDKGAIESLRASQMQMADNMSRRMMASMLAAAEVFTPEQRTKLAQRMEKRMAPHQPG